MRRAHLITTRPGPSGGRAVRRGTGEAAFYGPKIDIQVVDAAGREETLSTVQLNFLQPQWFGLSYVDGYGWRGCPVMVHRSLVGSRTRRGAGRDPVRGSAPRAVDRACPGVPAPAGRPRARPDA